MVWLCSCADAYQSYCCVESVILSLLFNPELEVPDIASLKQLKDRERAARANPFTAATFDAEKLKEKERKKAEKLEPNWQPTLATFSAAHASSAVAKALQPQPEGCPSLTLLLASSAVPVAAAQRGAMPPLAGVPPSVAALGSSALRRS